MNTDQKCNWRQMIYENIFILLLCISFCAYGLFHEAFCAVFSVLTFIIAIYIVIKNGSVLSLSKSFLICILMTLPVFAGISIIFAADAGVAVVGIVKFLPLTAAAFLIAQMKYSEKGFDIDYIFKAIPLISSVLLVISLVSYFTPFKEFFYIDGRFSGTFQYANSFALLLLVSYIIVIFSDYKMVTQLILVFVQIAGIIATGSRAVFILTVAVTIVWFVLQKGISRKRCAAVSLCLVGTSCAAVVIGMITGKLADISRFTDIDFSSSSFAARLLYNIDGFKMLASHPFGMGYKGFLFEQGAYQTGNYSATFAHNELLQTGLDFGIIAMILVLAGYILAIRDAKDMMRKTLLVAVGLHSLMDWDFQFVSLLLIVILAADTDKVKQIQLKKSMIAAGTGVVACICALSLWIGAGCYMEYLGKYDAAYRIYPGLTISQMNVISNSMGNERYELAEAITSRNDYCVIALQAMAEKSAGEYDFEAMIEYGDKFIRAGRYNERGYELYIELLNYGINVMDQMGNQEGMAVLIEKTLEVEDKIEAVNKETNSLASRLSQDSYVELDSEHKEYINMLKNAIGAV